MIDGPNGEHVLVVDDDAAYRRAWTRLLRAEGYATEEAAAADDALAKFAKHKPRMVLLDLMLPPTGTPEAGAELLSKMLKADPLAKVIVISGTGDTSLALSLVRRGAYDFLAKPVDPDVLSAVIARAHARLVLEDRVAELQSDRQARAEGPLGQAATLNAARTLAERAAASGIPVLITGESGTGKEVFARFVHERSPRATKPWVAINCGAIARELLESTLFGHRKGAFTGATQDAKGVFAEADGGTLFLDEIGDLALDLQVKLLRALESGEIMPVGASKPVVVDVRIVSATHRPLEELIAAKSFREDLYWRIRGIEIALPKLADRPGDILLLAQHFLNQSRSLVPGSPPTQLSPEAQRALETFAWPGNLRQLRHEMQRALVMAAGRGEILLADLSPELAALPQTHDTTDDGTLEQKVARLEQREIARILSECGGNRSQAAERLGLSRQGLLNKMARFGIR